ncbi:MAG TPA: DUF222 domain-containing protein [Acidimicrobiia bacterium]|nr:DUF222 domain-containing protein [Acidimicrobiia bacterium]
MDEVLSHLFAGCQVFLAEICDWLIEVDRRQQFLADGARDLAEWVSARFGLRHATAVQLVGVARRLQDLPLLRERFGAGVLSLDQVDAISRIATPDTEQTLLEEALGLSNAMLDRAARRANPPTTEDEERVWRDRWLSIQHSLDGSEGRLHARLPGADLHLVESAIRERADRFGPNPETNLFDPYPVRLADGLVEVCVTSGDESSPSVQVTLHADLEALTTTETGVAELQAGPVISNETARRLACDSIVETAVYDDCRVLGVGRRTRMIPGWLRRQLWSRDGGCRFPGCGRQGWVHGHHIRHWADGGPTDLENLVLLCGFHHRFLHETGWTVAGDPAGKLTFNRPDGRTHPPPRPELHPRLQELVRT